MKLLVICLAICLMSVVKSNPLEGISEGAGDEVPEEGISEDAGDAVAEGEGEAFRGVDSDEEYSDEDELTEEEIERVFGIDIPKCMEHTDLRVDLRFSHKTDCSKFYLCSYGKAHLMDCPGTQHFSVQLDRCDYQRIVKCKPNGEHQFKVRKTNAINVKA